MDKIARIRQEIERLKSTLCLCDNDWQMAIDGWQMKAYDNILSFLDTLSEELGKSLDEAAEELADEHGFIKNPDCKPAKYSWQAVRDVFIEAAKAGAEWQKEQMLKDAVEGQIYGSDGDHWIESEIYENLKGKEGDKVRIVVLKEEEE